MNPPYIPATVLGGDLVRDWTGPAAYVDSAPAESRADGVIIGPDEGGRGPYTVASREGWYVMNTFCETRSVHAHELRLDPRRPEVAHRITDVLRARGHEVGHLLPVALGGRVGDGVVVTSAVLLASCVAGVESGRGVVRGVLGIEDTRCGYSRRQTLAGCGPYVDAYVDDNGWRVRVNHILTDSGPETGPDGRKCADAALLRLGYAYLDAAAPFGVVVPFTSAEGR